MGGRKLEGGKGNLQAAPFNFYPTLRRTWPIWPEYKLLTRPVID